MLLGDVAMAAKRDGGLTLAQKHFQLEGLQGLGGQLEGEGGASPALKNLIPAAYSATKLACYSPSLPVDKINI